MNPTIVKMPDGTLKKFYGRKQVYLADKFVKENQGSKRLVSSGKVLDSAGVHRGKYVFDFPHVDGKQIKKWPNVIVSLTSVKR